MTLNKITVINLLVCILSLQTVNSRTSSVLWKLNGNVIYIPSEVELLIDDDTFNIISTTNIYEDGWNKYPNIDIENSINNLYNAGSINKKSSNVLDCGKPVNFTYYDDLIGIKKRYYHTNIVPEPEVAFTFLKKRGSSSINAFDIDALERKLRKAKREKHNTVQLYNQIGNFWRIKGNAQISIECFRKALNLSPQNSEVLLNLARVLYNLQYLDDAIHLTRRSLEVNPLDKSAWRQYLTLGEIFNSYGHHKQSILHLRHALELNPQHEQIREKLRELENVTTSTSLNIYTLLIILCLASGVLYIIIASNDRLSFARDDLVGPWKPNQRSFKGFYYRSYKHRK